MREIRRGGLLSCLPLPLWLLVGIALFFPSFVVAQGIIGSAHDFSSQGWSSNRVCEVCHTPHNAQVVDAPLWDHEVNAAVNYAMYTSPTLDMDNTSNADGPQGVSLACLGCHDGATAIDSFAGNSGVQFMPDGPTKLGLDLSDDHPISITYDAGADPYFNSDDGEGHVGVLQLYISIRGSNQVECGTCHNPHDPSNVPFLRVDNIGSALCFICHNK